MLILSCIYFSSIYFLYHFHLPGLFEFYDFYSKFLKIYYENRGFFYDFCEIGSIYGSPSDCLWNGGRVGFGDDNPKDVYDLMNKYGISARLTFSNSLLKEEHLTDERCNRLVIFSIIEIMALSFTLICY